MIEPLIFVAVTFHLLSAAYNALSIFEIYGPLNSLGAKGFVVNNSAFLATAPILSGVIFTFPVLYELSSLPFTPVILSLKVNVVSSNAVAVYVPPDFVIDLIALL